MLAIVCFLEHIAYSLTKPKGYTMRFIDLSEMVSIDVGSREPVINDNRDCIGVYHGVIGNVNGYGVNALDVNEFLD